MRQAPAPLRHLRKHLSRLLLERRCLACGAPVRGKERGLLGGRLCADCAAALARREKGFCPRCGEINAWPALEPSPCARCLVAPPPWQRFLFHGVYEGMLRELILRLKLGGELPLARLFGLLLLEHPELRELTAGLEDEEPILVVPVPLHPARLRARGFNQVLELARPLARPGFRLEPRLLCRTKNTPTQTTLHLDSRRRNLRATFSVTGDTRGQRILLLDDVATTGATLHETAEALLRAGADRVDVLVLARTPLPNRS